MVYVKPIKFMYEIFLPGEVCIIKMEQSCITILIETSAGTSTITGPRSLIASYLKSRRHGIIFRTKYFGPEEFQLA